MTDSRTGVYRIARPTEQLAPIVLDSPHSGMSKPNGFDPIVEETLWKAMCDPLVDQLFGDAPSLGAPLLMAQFPRVYIDANRADDDIEPSLFDGWDGPSKPTEKSELGKGLFWLNIKPDRRPIYASPLTGAEMWHRIKQYHRPYHAALKSLLDLTQSRFGCVYHINCHSMRRLSGTMDKEGPGKARVDFVISDRDGTSSEAGFVACAVEHLRNSGFTVAINDPFKGAEIVSRSGAPSEDRHSIQIEINRGLYLERDGLTASKDFPELKNTLNDWLRAMIRYAKEKTTGIPAV
ncbi:MAG: N-formylglutamate amidohydrolase [Pseudomonadota bacterium]